MATGQAEAQCAFILNPVHRVDAAAEGFGHVSAAEKGEAENSAGCRIGRDADLRQAVVDKEQLHDQGSIPAQLHIGGCDPAKNRNLPVNGRGTEETGQHSQQNSQRARPQSQPGGFPVKRQHLFDICPIHGTVFLSFVPAVRA